MLVRIYGFISVTAMNLWYKNSKIMQANQNECIISSKC